MNRLIFLATAIAIASASDAAPATSAKRPAIASRPAFGDGRMSNLDFVTYTNFRLSSPRDEFSPAPSEAGMDGKPFKFTVPLPKEPDLSLVLSGFGRTIPGYWEYDLDKEEVTFTLSPTLAGLDNGPELGDGFYVSYQAKSAGSYAIANGFGAKRTVVRHTGVGALVLEARRSASWDRTATVSLSPSEARAELPGARAVFSGVLAAYKPNAVTACGKHEEIPTIRYPTDTRDRLCEFSAHIAKVEIVGTSGKILAVFNGE